MSVQRSRMTDYAKYVYSNLPEVIAERGGVYNMNECAALVGLKPTPHFKKRISELVKLKVLKAEAVFTLRGGLQAVYSIHKENTLGDIPF